MSYMRRGGVDAGQASHSSVSNVVVVVVSVSSVRGQCDFRRAYRMILCLLGSPIVRTGSVGVSLGSLPGVVGCLEKQQQSWVEFPLLVVAASVGLLGLGVAPQLVLHLVTSSSWHLGLSWRRVVPGSRILG